MATSIWFWVFFLALILTLLALDLGIFHRDEHVVRPAEAGMWTVVWVLLALAFGGWIWWREGQHLALTYLTGYLIEESLSADNVFVIATIFAWFKVEPRYQHRVLFWGILGALVMRGAFIAAGTVLLRQFEWILYIFGALLLFTAWRMAFGGGEDFDPSKSAGYRLAQRFLPISTGWKGKHFFTIENGKRLATPLFVVLIVVEVSDLVFAIDSIPAIFAITQDPFIVFTSNVFAVLGLRSLYFVLAHAMSRFRYLQYGLAAILGFVGIKMLIAHWVVVPIPIALGVVAAALGLSIAVSLARPAKGERG